MTWIGLVVDNTWPTRTWLFDNYQPWLSDLLATIRDTLGRSQYEDDLYTAALQTRQAIVSEPDSGEAVKAFARRHLRIRRVNQDVVGAVGLVLLEASGWTPTPHGVAAQFLQPFVEAGASGNLAAAPDQVAWAS